MTNHLGHNSFGAMTRLRVSGVACALVGLIFMAAASLPASAIEYRKCHLKVVVSGIDFPEVRVEGADFWSWSRKVNASAAWDGINSTARACASAVASRDGVTLPSACASNEAVLKGGGFGSGITGLKTTSVHTLLKKTICENHVRPDPKVRSINDTRVIEGLTVVIKHITERSDACFPQRALGPQKLTIHCRSRGQGGPDTQATWFYDP